MYVLTYDTHTCWENFGTELQQNQITFQNLMIMGGCRGNSVSVFVKCF